MINRRKDPALLRSDGPGKSQLSHAKPVRLSRRPSRFKALHLLALIALSLTLLEILFVNNDSVNNAGTGQAYGSAAIATQPSRVNNKLDMVLPDNKAEAAAFVRQHNSLFNFDQVAGLRGQLSSGLKAAGANNVQSIAGFNAGPALTPRPTSTGNLSSQNLAPNAATPTNTCTTNPGADTYEPDNDFPLASTIGPGDYPSTSIQNHTLQSGDVDYIKFTATNPSYYYIVDLINIQPAGLDPLMVLYFANGTVYEPRTDNTTATTNRYTLTYKPSSDEVAAGGNFYIKINQNPAVSCLGSYSIRVSFSTNTDVISTPTPTSTATPSGTTTPNPCRDTYESDDAPENAKELRVSYGLTPPFSGTPGIPDVQSSNNNVQSHIICPTGDQDWVYFDLVKGKPYSLFTKDLSNGLDTMLVLFSKDASGNLQALYANDDFPGMGLASRIDFVTPANDSTATGEFVRYYAVAKDVSGKGIENLSYSLVLTSPGDGKGECVDYYEPDGLQYLAKEILINETQSRALCPSGDADWVKFFAKAGRSYSLKTTFSNIPGMDTYLNVFSIIFDPNDPTQVVSQNLIASNDDASATDLSSQATFSVPVDGVYYAQIKNNGDRGGPGFVYQLSYTVSGGSAAAPDNQGTATAIAGTAAASTATARARATATARQQTATALGTPAATATPTPTPDSQSQSLMSFKFGDPSFQKLWYYSDLAVAQNQAQRSWEWGPEPGVIAQEPYADAPGGMRQVQYFDKSRMEINNPKGDRNSPWFVSNGLLVREMITGQVAKGDQAFEQRSPANIPVAGDATADNTSPTYARFSSLITNGDNNRALDLTGQVVKQGLATDGSIWTLATPPEAIKFGAYIKETGHNIPSVFWDYMLSAGKVFDNGYKEANLRDWVFAMGYPLSEPYWIKARVGGMEKDVLVQVFERRVLTYTPSNSPEWRIEMANVGQHYFLWRYGRNLHDQNP
ncbi:MAG TPA: hypothetical protein VH186_08075 [Chloroflexia bacterium]|nr:hypothetical protein [Chloroflexia bacterium]